MNEVEAHKKITVAVIADGMPAGGTERQIVELLRGIKLSCPNIRMLFGVLVKGGERELEAAHWASDLLLIQQSRELDITLAWSLIGLVRKYSIDILHTFGSISDLSAVVAAKVCGIKSINGSIRSARSRLTRRDIVSKFAMRYADAVVANSTAGLRAFDMHEKPFAQVIYNGLDLDRFSTVEAINYQAPYLCMVGNFTPKKDQKALIESFPLILQEYPQYHLVLIGKGDLEADCHKRIKQLELADQVVIVNDCNEPGPWVKGAEICLLLSPDGEGLSNVLMEYCALSRPIIASDKGGNSEIIENGVSGRLLRSHDPVEVSSTILELLRNEEKMKELASQARRIVSEKFSRRRMIDEYADLYAKIVLPFESYEE